MLQKNAITAGFFGTCESDVRDFVRVANELGFPIAHEEDSYLDHELLDALRGKNGVSASKIIEQRDSFRPKGWGYAHPKLWKHRNRIVGLVRNPVFIFIMRDPVISTIQKNHPVHSNGELNILKMRQAINLQREYVDESCPSHFFSYEKLVNNPEESIDYLAQILNVEVPVISYQYFRAGFNGLHFTGALDWG